MEKDFGVVPSVVSRTQSYRELGLPKQLIVIEDFVEYAYILESRFWLNDKCPVIVWSGWIMPL